MSNADKSQGTRTKLILGRELSRFQKLNTFSVPGRGYGFSEADVVSKQVGEILGNCCNTITTVTAPTIAPPTVPDSPTSVSASARNENAVVSFTAPASDGGSSIIQYTVTSNPGGFTATGLSSPITITGLTNGTSYTFTVIATNTLGNSLASSASSSVTPSFIDSIIISLTTSLSSYNAAATDDWVKITSSEYSNLQTNISGTAIVGLSNSYMALVNASGFTMTDQSAILLNTATNPNTPAIAANTYLYGFAIKYRMNNPDAVSDARIFTNTNVSSYTGFNQVGSTLPALTNGASGYGMNYYVRKAASSVNGATAGLLSIFTGQTNNSAKYLGFYQNFAVRNSMRYQLYSPASTGGMPNSTTSLNGNLAGYGAFAIQGLTTSTKQWV